LHAFIKITEPHSGRARWLNVDAITSFYRDEDGSTYITIAGSGSGWGWVATESCEEIIQLIIKAIKE
jgi:hypothetical protein